MNALFADVTFSTEGIVVITGLLGALAAAIGVLWRQVMRAKDEKAEIFKSLAEEAVASVESAGNTERKRKGLPARKRKADVVPESNSPPTEEQKETADAATLRARLVAARKDLGIKPRKAGDDPSDVEDDEDEEVTVAPAAAVAEIVASVAQIITAVNPGACLMFGYGKPDELIDQSVTMLIPERFRPAHLAATQRVVRSGMINYVEKVLSAFGLRKDGSEFPVQITVRAQRVGDGWVFHAVFLPEPATLTQMREDVLELTKKVDEVPQKTANKIKEQEQSPPGGAS